MVFDEETTTSNDKESTSESEDESNKLLKNAKKVTSKKKKRKIVTNPVADIHSSDSSEELPPKKKKPRKHSLPSAAVSKKHPSSTVKMTKANASAIAPWLMLPTTLMSKWHKLKPPAITKDHPAVKRFVKDAVHTATTKLRNELTVEHQLELQIEQQRGKNSAARKQQRLRKDEDLQLQAAHDTTLAKMARRVKETVSLLHNNAP